MKKLIGKGIPILLTFFILTSLVCCSNAKTLIFQHNGQIWKQYTSGKNAVMLIAKGDYPAWTPAVKTHFAYVERQTGNPLMKLWVAEDDGKNAVALTKFEVGYDFSWSPDGKWIAVAHTKDGNYEIYKIKIDGTALTRLTTNSYTDRFPAWSPKGNEIAFISARSGNEGIFVINADGTNEKQVTPKTLKVLDNLHSRLSWSMDGKAILFVGRWGTQYDIGIVEVQTGKVTRLTNQGGAHDPLWYETFVFYFLYNDLYRHDMSSGETKNLGRFVPEIPHSALSANASYVFFSYGPNAPNPPHIYRVQHYTADKKDIGPGSWPDVW